MQALGLDPEVVGRVAGAAHRAARGSASRQGSIGVALLAASAESLLGGYEESPATIAGAQERWRFVASVYEFPIAAMAAVCGGIRDYAYIPSGGDATAHAYYLLSETVSVVGASAAFEHDFEIDDATPTGRTGIPLHMWREAFGPPTGARALEPPSPDRIAEVVGTALSYGGRAVESAMQDRYHWQHLQCPLLPVEPELLAIASVGVGALARVAPETTIEPQNAPAFAALEVARSFWIEPEAGPERAVAV